MILPSDEVGPDPIGPRIRPQPSPQPGQADVQLSVALQKVLKEIQQKLETGEVQALDIAEFLSVLDPKDQEELKRIAGDDGKLDLKEVGEALDVEAEKKEKERAH